MRTVRITVPETPPSLNEILRMHYHERHKENERWAGLVAMFDNRRKRGEPFKKASVTITYYFGNRVKRDPDNFAGKFILDSLVKTGVIEDDSFSNVDLLLVGKVDKDNPRTEILVEEVRE